MLTEGWDANTVTHILGVRAFGTQLLCEQVVGRALRRLSYEPGENRDPDGHPLLDAEYADILGIPFDFASEAVRTERKPPKPVTRIVALKEREGLTIRFPRVAGYRKELPGDRFVAVFTDNSKFEITPAMVGASQARLEGVVGEGHDIAPGALDAMTESGVAMALSKKLVENHFNDDGMLPYHLVGKLQPIARRWIRECVTIKGEGMKTGMLAYPRIADRAAALIYAAMKPPEAEGEPVVRAVLDHFSPTGSSADVSFITSKETLWHTRADRCHVNIVVCDSDWEAEFARVVEKHPDVISYVKNQALGFEIVYRDGGAPRRYLPDFIVRIDDGRGPDDPLNLIAEVKGEKDVTDQIKIETARKMWVEAVNNLGDWGRWAFHEFSDPFTMETEFAALVSDAQSRMSLLDEAARGLAELFGGDIASRR
jgi:type III restriction enzyme